MLAIDRDVGSVVDTAPRRRGGAPAGGAECCGRAEDHRAQRVLFAARGWISEQEGVATEGRALLLLHAHRTAPDRREALVRCFERVLLHAPQEEIAALAASLRGAGLAVDDRLATLAAPAGEARAAVQALERFRPLPAAWRLTEVGPDDGDAEIAALQELQAACGVAPLPGWYLRGGEGRAITLALRDADGVLLGCTTMSVITRPPAEASARGGDPPQLGLLGAPPLWISDVGDPPSSTGMPIATCLRDDVRGRGLAASLNGAGIRAGHERLGIRWFYAIVRPGDEIASRMHARCGLVPHLAEGFLLAGLGR